MNFSKHQRDKYLHPAKMLGVETEIRIFHVPRKTCFERIINRKDHPTINGLIPAPKGYDHEPPFYSLDEKKRQANSALDTFFTKYERVEDTEAETVKRLGWDGKKT
jgi:hypothetical protein